MTLCSVRLEDAGTFPIASDKFLFEIAIFWVVVVVPWRLAEIFQKLAKISE